MNNPKMILIEWLPTNSIQGYDNIIGSNLVYDYIIIERDNREVFLFQTENDYVLWKLKFDKYENDVFKIIRS